MPFKSQAQRRKFAQLLVEGKITDEQYEEWNRSTGTKSLPERVGPKGAAKKGAAKKGAAKKAGVKKPAARKKVAATTQLLTPEQRVKYEEFLSRHSPGDRDGRRGGDRGGDRNDKPTTTSRSEAAPS